jgi:DNA-binding transcriptional LysR family regulator
MDLRHARTFVTIAELGSVSKAALRLRIAQPALSRQISNLEQELGLQLFDRVGRRLVLNGEGEQLLSDCRTLLSCASAVGARAQLLRRGDTGVLKVSGSPQVIESVFSGFLPRYAKRYPNVEVRLVEATGTQTLEFLERGEVHLGQNLAFTARAADARFASYPLAPMDLLAVSQPSLKLGSGGAIDVRDLAHHPLLLLDATFAFRRTFDAACRMAKLDIVVKFESRAPHTLLALAEAGHGVAVIGSVVQTSRHTVRTTRITYRGRSLREALTIMWDKRRPLPPYATAFSQMLAPFVREVLQVGTETRIVRSDVASGSANVRRLSAIGAK